MTAVIHPIPLQVYHYGANVGFYSISYLIAMLLTSEVFLPIFYKLEITSTFEVRVPFSLFSCCWCAVWIPDFCCATLPDSVRTGMRYVCRSEITGRERGPRYVIAVALLCK